MWRQRLALLLLDLLRRDTWQPVMQHRLLTLQSGCTQQCALAALTVLRSLADRVASYVAVAILEGCLELEVGPGHAQPVPTLALQRWGPGPLSALYLLTAAPAVERLWRVGSLPRRVRAPTAQVRKLLMGGRGDEAQSLLAWAGRECSDVVPLWVSRQLCNAVASDVLAVSLAPWLELLRRGQLEQSLSACAAVAGLRLPERLGSS